MPDAPLTRRERLLVGLVVALTGAAAYLAQPWLNSEQPSPPPQPCRRHFLHQGGDDLNRCAGQYAAAGLTLTAFAPNLGIGGSFEPGERRWWSRLSSVTDIDGKDECADGHVADLRGGPVDSAWALTGSNEGRCRLVALRVNGADTEPLEDPKIRARYATLVAQQGSDGYAPERVVFRDSVGAGTTPSAYILFRKSEPHDTASIYLADRKQAAAFEARAAAKGYRPFRYESNPLEEEPRFIDEVWRRRPDGGVQMKTDLDEDEFAQADEAFVRAGYRLIDLDGGGLANGISAIWEKPLTR